MAAVFALNLCCTLLSCLLFPLSTGVSSLPAWRLVPLRSSHRYLSSPHLLCACVNTEQERGLPMAVTSRGVAFKSCGEPVSLGNDCGRLQQLLQASGLASPGECLLCGGMGGSCFTADLFLLPYSDLLCGSWILHCLLVASPLAAGMHCWAIPYGTACWGGECGRRVGIQRHQSLLFVLSSLIFLSSTALQGLIHRIVLLGGAVLQNRTAGTPPPGPGTTDPPLVRVATVKICPTPLILTQHGD